MSIVERMENGTPVLISDSLAAAGGVAHGFSTRLGGVSTGMWESLNLGLSRGDDPDRVRENYRRFFSAIGAETFSLAMADQVHGTEIHNVTTADCKQDPYTKKGLVADGLMTAIPGIALIVFCSDCIPVLLYDPKRRVIAALPHVLHVRHDWLPQDGAS